MKAQELIRWILTDGRLLALGEDPEHGAGNPVRFVDALCSRLVAAGLPLICVSLYAATLHPQTNGFAWRWSRDRGCEEICGRQADELAEGILRDTIEHGTVRRHQLEEADGERPLLAALRAAGATDHVSAPLNHLGGNYPAIAWATERAGGFADTELALLDEIRPALAAVIETLMTVRTARGLFLTYHGRHVSDRVVDGQIGRGHVEPLRAVIMAIDLRGFTALSDHLPAANVIALLNHYFEVVSSAVRAYGGAVLKFIGDGVLAVFSTDGEPDRSAARAALSAARKILANLATHSFEGQKLRVGIGLHLGTVLYGNVGSSDRLDFTVIGPAVNLAFRLESLTKDLGVPIVGSYAFARAAGMPLPSLGSHPIRGLGGEEEVFGASELEPAL